MTVYELIQELAKYDANAEVYFRVEGRVKEYEELKREQLGEEPDENFYYTVEGIVRYARSWESNPCIPNILGEIIY